MSSSKTAGKSRKALPLDQTSYRLMRRLVVEHVRKHAWMLGGAVIAMIIGGAAQASLAKMIEPVLDDVFTSHDRAMLWGIGLAIFATFLVKGLAAYAEDVLMNRVGQRIVADLQQRLFGHLVRADLAFFHDRSSAMLTARFTNDINLMRAAVSSALTGLGKDVLSLVFLVALMFYQDWLLAVIAFVAFPSAILPIARLGKRMRKVSRTTQAEVGQLATLLDQVFQGMRHVKAYGMEAYETERARVISDRLYGLQARAGKVRALSRPIMETLGGFAIVGVILYGGSEVIAGTRTTGTFFSFITALLLAYEPAKRLANLNVNLQEGLAAAQRVFQLIDEKPEIADAPNARPLTVTRGEIRFEDVGFSYRRGPTADPNQAIPVALDGVNLIVEAGKTVALVGASGAGKSTLLNLIPRFFDVDKGRVLIDGVDIRDTTLDSLRAGLGLVAQEVGLFDDTVRANIAYGRPAASQAEIEQAARDAAAHDFILALPQGYDTPVGEQGVKLSGGQRQRVAIARAMLKDPPILLLDEATSALDTESERHVQTALKRLMKGRTVLVIAHRLSTVVDADMIYVMSVGRVIEAGRHRELLAQGGTYARLYRLQFADQLEEAPLLKALP